MRTANILFGVYLSRYIYLPFILVNIQWIPILYSMHGIILDMFFEAYLFPLEVYISPSQ